MCAPGAFPVGSAAAGLRAQLWVLALGEDRLSIHTAGSSIPALSAGHPSLPGWERSWGGGKDGGERGREGGGGSDVQLFSWGEKV